MKVWIDIKNVLKGDFRLGTYTGKVIFKLGKYKICKTYMKDNDKFIENV